MPSAKDHDEMDRQAEIALMESAWERIREQLETERHRVNEEIKNYPPPIAACHAQFNYLLEVWSQQVRAVHYGNAASQDVVQNATSEVTEDVRNGATFKFKIHRGLPTYTFHLVGNREFNVIDRIEVSKGNDTTIIQVLKDFEMDGPPYRGAKYFQAEDINFDGYADIKLLSLWGATGNRAYSYWLFEPKEGRFVFNQELKDLINPTPNYKRKQIKTHWVGGMAGYIYGNADYAFVKGRLVSIREVQQDWVKDKKYFLRVIRERRNGKMVIVSRKIIRVAGLD